MGKSKKLKGKTIILTGSMKPERFYNSDASFNISVAIGAINAFSEGVYLAMNGIIRPYYDVIKDKNTGFFVSLKENSYTNENKDSKSKRKFSTLSSTSTSTSTSISISSSPLKSKRVSKNFQKWLITTTWVIW